MVFMCTQLAEMLPLFPLYPEVKSRLKRRPNRMECKLWLQAAPLRKGEREGDKEEEEEEEESASKEEIKRRRRVGKGIFLLGRGSRSRKKDSK